MLEKTVKLQLDLETGKALADVVKLEHGFEASAAAGKKLELAVAAAAREEKKAAANAEAAAQRRAEWARQATKAMAMGAVRGAVAAAGLGEGEQILDAAAKLTAGQTFGAGADVQRAQFEANCRMLQRQQEHERKIAAYAQGQRTVAGALGAMLESAASGGLAGGAAEAIRQTAQAVKASRGGA
ncbi:MAG: hypothetical protein FD152_676 [Xanthobacteraceae bacterium]|nr:MAG: hypothetical protein FD152_676 [Xanthobacteraceae bacterium]